MNQDRTSSTSTIPTTSQPAEALRSTAAARTAGLIERPPGSMRVLILDSLEEESHQLNCAKVGATVQATARIDSVTPTSGGRARGVIGNNTGTAIFTVASDFLPRLDSILRPGAKVTVRGTVTRVGRFSTIAVYAARAVSA